MKKTVLLLMCSVLIYASCKQGGGSQTNSLAATPNKIDSNSYTLNGIPFKKANKMVNLFIKDPGSYTDTSQTCVWFTAAALDSMYQTLLRTNADGIRFYFARTIENHKYTVVAVSTKYGGIDSVTKRKIHADFFEVDTINVDAKGKLGLTTPAQGALLYSKISPCPSTPDTCPKLFHYITCNEGYKMVNYYGSDPINVTSSWYEITLIEALVKSLKTYHGDGLRIYYARHLNPHRVTPTDTIHRHGFALITTAATNKIHVDYYGCLDSIPVPGHPHRFFTGGADNGEECPTNCNGITWPN
ncbi:hypothetical protein JN11_01627 [Mucilaginibacter frigoritolerans]|jgi:hypothetical protein|uniref:Uncharacterized protein n=1 Tax=Mucilaginibacter frigoritolerans TaxID=652788 RepID=A0A562U6Q4_9SPHI|nr:hypothetical protein [Mucilaginibacter frigoritolerans]TWJ01476.1 hypothetical protein JN11_01627 [Mucilaginibacter frigoritolerans]